jgi:hypothetical protein
MKYVIKAQGKCRKIFMKKSNLIAAVCLATIYLTGCNNNALTQPTPGTPKPQTQTTTNNNQGGKDYQPATKPQTQTTTVNNQGGPDYQPAADGTQTHATTINNSGGKDYTPPSETGLNNPFAIKVNDSVQLESEGLTIKLTAIEDSRCASDVQCIWAGNVKAKVNVSKFDTVIGDVELVTDPGKNASAGQKIGDYTIKISGILPESKKSSEVLKTSDYSVSLIVTRN